MRFHQFAVLFLGFTLALPAQAQEQAVAWPVLDSLAREAYLIDQTTGTVLYSKNADQRMPTSSMSKVMTIYMVLEAIKNGQLALDQKLPVSEKAWRMQGSKMFVHVGDMVAVEDLIRGVIIQSGNDACIVLAEAVAGSEEAFALRMTARAKELGLKHSNFRNSTGWPDPEHYSTAEDLATLANRLMHDFPDAYHYYGEKEFTFNGIKQGNRNPLLYRSIGADGMKTGHTEVAGYGLIGSAQRDGRRLTMVVNGLSNMQARADESARLIEWGFSQFRLVDVVKSGETLDRLPVWFGEKKDIAIASPQDIKLTLPYGGNPSVKIVANTPLASPVTAGQEVAQLVVTQGGGVEKAYPLVAMEDAPALGFWGRMGHRIGSIF